MKALVDIQHSWKSEVRFGALASCLAANDAWRALWEGIQHCFSEQD